MKPLVIVALIWVFAVGAWSANLGEACAGGEPCCCYDAEGNQCCAYVVDCSYGVPGCPCAY